MTHRFAGKAVVFSTEHNSLVVRHTVEAQMCGICAHPMSAHPIVNNEVVDGSGFVMDDEVVCDRTEEDFGTYEFDYFLHPSSQEGKHNITLVVDAQGAGTTVLSREDEYDSIHALGDYHSDTDDNYTRSGAVANWRDQYPNEGTLTLAQHAQHIDNFRRHLTYGGNAETRTAFVEGSDGFLSLKFVDEALTAKYHAHLLNVFRDKKTSDVRVGSVRVYKTIDGHYAAACVNRNCPRGTDRPKILRNDEFLTRESMETFVSAVVRHGNNHAAGWFADKKQAKVISTTLTTECYDTYSLPNCESSGLLNGPISIPNGKTLSVTLKHEEVIEHRTFYKVHGNDCDLNCGDRTMPCNTNVKRPSPLTDDEVVAFLLDHNSMCKDSNCKCAERLAELVPALA